ncbi:hypothetical protein GJU39_20930 [Pedobacter petrophilus]|uniref:Cold-shock protein n=1 Tax=Pedobacter petrophilus TaxID=1908241 RepID=A0A7K0G420_9SPHI|nr:hypothetical protein [Pedobacter petrophilus]MRX78547.1 hypothetical protein [Pedobacter petrophilus]
MERLGEIIDLNCIIGVGTILDFNDQEILFNILDMTAFSPVGFKVNFEIELKTEGLRAVKINPFGRP